MTFDIDLFNQVLSDWEYKEIYINDECVYSVNSDTEFTIKNFITKLHHVEEYCSIALKNINIMPYEKDGVTIKFEIEVRFWQYE